ncbi:hypothetical protein AHF37_09143 [Paragonimus kellicotti]|nr:hypothetical protein AHF37_09143 [Paragonimus kellicotti]
MLLPFYTWFCSAPSHNPNDPPTYERLELGPYDQINCSERARFADVWGFSDDGLELFVGSGQAPTIYTFDKLYPYRWRVKKFPAAGQWRLGCRLDTMVPRWIDVVVKGYPDVAQIIPWSPETLSVHDRTVFECTCGNQAHLSNFKAKFAWKSGQKIFEITRTQFVLANLDTEASEKETTPPTYECTIQMGDVTLVKSLTVKLIYGEKLYLAVVIVLNIHRQQLYLALCVPIDSGMHRKYALQAVTKCYSLKINHSHTYY